MIIKEINDKQEKKEISTSILGSLPNWFGIQESTQEYIFTIFIKSCKTET